MSYKKPPLLIYQMGKVASMTIQNTLEPIYNGLVHHIHYFMSGDVKYVAGNAPEKIKSELKDCYNSLKTKDKQIKIMTMFREPIARNLSSFYMNLDPEFRRKHYEKPLHLIELFKEKYTQAIPLRWFENEFYPVTGIDILKHNFDKDKGFTHITKDNIEVLVFCVEIEDKLKTSLISNFLEIQDFSLINSNVSSKKYYADGYKNFLKHAKFSENFINDIYNNDVMKFFYNEKDIKKFKNKWLLN